MQAAHFEGSDFSGDQLVDIAWALATAAHWTPNLDELAAAISLRGGLAALPPFQATSVLWSFATLYHTSGDFFTDASAFAQGS